ncbi:MAG: transcription-repair coupling factor [Clostridia bacterium]|nr:transcription-repair coupling factor [Clostridia bacterium]
MNFLFKELSLDADYKSLLNSVLKDRMPIVATGLSDIHKALVVSALTSELSRKAVIITDTEAAANTLKDDFNSFGVSCVNFPSRDYCIGDIEGYSREYEHKRIHTLSKLLDGDFSVLTMSVEAALQYTVPKEILRDNLIELKVGKEYDLKALISALISGGYSRCEQCSGAGQFSVRGGILDVFPVNSLYPYRVEFWGDEIDSICEFDVLSQRRNESVDSITVCPASEVIFDAGELAKTLEEYAENGKDLTDKQEIMLNRDAEKLYSGINICSDRYIPLIYKEGQTIFDYLDENAIFILANSGNISAQIKTLSERQNMDAENFLSEGFLSKETFKLYLNEDELYDRLCNVCFMENFPRNSYEMAIKDVVNFNLKRSSAWSGDINILLDDISYLVEQGGKVVILAGEKRAAMLLSEQLCEKGMPCRYDEKPEEIGKGITVLAGGLSAGFEIPSVRFMLITHRYIAAENKKRKKYKVKDAKAINSIEELKKGDYVVHDAHGIGIFDGINRITNDGVTKDYIRIKYAKSDVLYVPVNQLDLVSKYIGAAAENGSIKVNRLGGVEWQKTRSRVRAAVKNMAKQLTALYARRMAAKGYAFSPDTDLQNDFERRFEYDETDDQLRAINEIKRDMEREVPMDRLLCGDVGFGKTEVALRAAFKCISEGKQCAVLVPTTILAMQHYNTILRRFGDMPVTVGMLSRFVTKRKQEQIVKDLKDGRLDLVVGTHRLISKDVEFKNIGLVIIDEEQRFGVAQKERLKELYPFVDILTLSATPIPRTLNMAMSGLRDMSAIDEAPGDRYPVQTYVLEQNMGVIIDAINKEIRRGGQVYYLHNRVETITHCAARLKQRLPEDVNIGIAHGKMSEDELSDIWKKLLEHEIDVLVCTTIIETGVDVPNANTLIIENADRMGLSQLHQLRGRVGRSPRRAYAYFCFERNKQLTDIASKRLEAIREYTEFGSGFKIAMRDLEIRGAGSILGGEQHGNMEAVGYDMYLKLLSDAVNEQNGVEVKQEIVCNIDLNVSAFIPDNYIESLPARLNIYRRIADIKTDEDASDVIDELCDRFGEPPKTVMGLINISLLRNKAQSHYISEITQENKQILLETNELREETVSALSSFFGDRFSLSATAKNGYLIKIPDNEKLTSVIEEIIKAL